ncbi:shikimate kinase [Staphylococcus sp. 17KM0847]|nr:shikimate kinase [Staphylococcus sp. 17KM0847]QLK86967.1 shikimate kinase [Staphylococcus sp. 17KM0847]
MGAGKTTIGQTLAQKYNLRFVDLDLFISESEKRSIPEIFQDEGEQAFRKYEYYYLNNVIDTYDIIATGGGILTNDQTFNYLKTVNAHIIWLDAPFPHLYSRIKNDNNRPNAANKDEAAVKSLYYKRISRYNEIAFSKIATDNSFEQILNEIEKVLCANDQY